MKKPTILWLSDAPQGNTGFSSQSLFLMNGLAERGWDVHYISHNYYGQKLPPKGLTFEDGTTCNFWLHGHGREAYCKDILIPKIRDIKPDVFGILLDTFMLHPWYAMMDFAPAKTTWWYPSDGGGRLPLNCEHLLSRCNLPVAMSKFAQKQAKDVHNLNSEYIPHGVNTSLFSPMNPDEREKAKAAWGLLGKFVVGTVYRNQPRKFADRQIKAFAKFAKGKDDVVLLCHTDPHDAASSFDTFQLIRDLGIQNKVIFTGMSWLQGFPYEKMREVYNLFDIYLSSTSGEGFGVCTIEAMSCGVPVVITKYTTSEELVGENNCGELVNLVGEANPDFMGTNSKEYDTIVEDGTILGSWMVERGIMSIKDCSVKLEKLYQDWKTGGSLIKEYGLNGRKAALEKFSWEVIIDAWDKRLRKLIE